MMTAEFMLSKRPVLRFTAALFFLLTLPFRFSKKFDEIHVALEIFFTRPHQKSICSVDGM